MTKTLKISQPLFNEVQDGHVWLISVSGEVVATAKSRAAARAAKTEGAVIVKTAEVELEIIGEEVAPVAKTKKVRTPRVRAPKIPIFHQSEIESPCAVVWSVAQSNPGLKRNEVIAKCVSMGVAFYTARTQYQLWMKSKQADAAAALALNVQMGLINADNVVNEEEGE